MASDKQPRNNAARKTVSGETKVPTTSQPVSTAAPTSSTSRNAVIEGDSSFDMDEVRKRAYELYEQDGRTDGNHESHWHRAEQEIKSRRNGKHVNTAKEPRSSSKDGKRIA